MGFLTAGFLLLFAVWCVFWGKDRFGFVTFYRLAHHEITARLFIVAVGLIVAGFFLGGADILEAMGVELRTTRPGHFEQ